MPTGAAVSPPIPALAWGGSVLGNVTKIARNAAGDLAGGVGFASTSAKFLEWFVKGEDGDPPKLIEDRDIYDRCFIIRAARRNEVIVYEPTGTHRPTIDYFAAGSGKPEALGAMFVGASAADAVRAAIAHDVHCGGHVVVLAHE